MKFNRNINCAICGGVEFGDQATVCPGCGGPHGYEDLRPLRSNGWLLAMILAGVFVMGPASFVWIGLYGHGMEYILLYIGLGLWLMAAFFGRLYSGPNWLTALFVSLPYALLIGNFLSGALSFEHNYSYYGTHWAREFFVIPALTYIAPLLFAYLGAHCAARRSAVSAMTAAIVFIVLLGGVISMAPSKQYSKSSENVSFALAENDDIQVWADIRCTYMKKKDYWQFRDLSEGECKITTLTVAGKNSEPLLPNNINWTIDGIEQSQPISLSFAPEDIALPSPVGSKSITRWRTGIPFEDLENADDVKLRWGSVQINFTEPQANRVKQLNEVLTRLASR